MLCHRFVRSIQSRFLFFRCAIEDKKKRKSNIVGSVVAMKGVFLFTLFSFRFAFSSRSLESSQRRYTEPEDGCCESEKY